MIIYRIANETFKNDLSGNGASIYGSRWNSPGRQLIHASEYISLCMLESLVHFDKNSIPDNQYLMHISIPGIEDPKEMQHVKLKKDWQLYIEYTRWMGDQFIKAGGNLALKVPSAIVEQEYNFLINPLHADFKKVKISRTELLHLDTRLFHTPIARKHNQ